MKLTEKRAGTLEDRTTEITQYEQRENRLGKKNGQSLRDLTFVSSET